MDEQFWDDVADRYEEEIFNVHQHDRRRVLARWLDELVDPDSVVADFGCGIGHGIPRLARRANTVYATDHSQRSLEIAQQRCAAHPNVVYAKRNLAARQVRLCKADVGLVVNVLIMPQRATRRAILENVRLNLKPDGHLLLVVPSLETVLYTCTRLVQWYVRDGMQYKKAVQQVAHDARRELASVVEGIVINDGTPTKHYLREEAEVMLASCGFKVLAAEKVEYPWEEDITDPPQWLAEPYPWDWLYVAQRVRRRRSGARRELAGAKTSKSN